MKYFIIIFLFCSNYIYAKGSMYIKKERKILFLGNSLTYYHDMPQTLQRMFNEQKLNIKVDQCTSGGECLLFHLTGIDKGLYSTTAQKGDTPTSVKKILSTNWEKVILQEGTLIALIPEFRRYICEPVVRSLDSLIKTVKGKTVLYQAFSLQQYPIRYCQNGFLFYI